MTVDFDDKGAMMLTWSNWHRFSELTANPAENSALGVYQIRASSDKRQAIPIDRACGTDPEGILYIGQGFLPDRIGRLMRIFEESPKHHHNFIPVFFEYGLERVCKRTLLEIRWAECKNAGVEEARLIYEYKKRTGDIPPGNRKLEGPPADMSADVEES